MFAVVLADTCRLVEEGSFLWYLWGCFLAPYTALACAGLAALVFAALQRRRVTVKA